MPPIRRPAFIALLTPSTCSVNIWLPGRPIPPEFLVAANDPNWHVVAHNDSFEAAIEERVLAPRYGWPVIPIERDRCTMAAALAAALPGKLENVAEALDLPFQKDREGYRLMRKLARRREPPTPGELDILAAYCARDVEVERAVDHAVPPLSPDEQALWILDFIVNRRGFHVDRDLAVAARKLAGEEQAAVNRAIAVLTEGEITTANQVARIRAFVEERGHALKSLSKRSVSAVLAHDPEAEVEQLLQLRRDGSRAAARKLDALLAGIEDDNRLRGCLRFHGAATGLWSGSRFQPQNLKKAETKNTDAAIDAILAADLERVRGLGAPLVIIGDATRAVICAPPGKILIGADFSAIESRVLAWIAGETWKVEAYRQYDATQDPALEPYCITASRSLRRPVTPEDEAGRAIGKTCDLAFGYGGGRGAFRRFDPSDTHSDAAVEKFKSEWRNAHRATVKFWRRLENALKRALRRRERIELGTLTFETIDGALFLTLPNGRRLAYPEPRIEPGKYPDTTQLVFKDNAKGGWRDVRGWHGVFVENVVAGISRDLLAAAMQRVEAAGYPVTLHVHDELVAEVPEDFGSVEDFVALMLELPDWAAALPIAAKGWRRQRYAKPAKAPAPPAESISRPETPEAIIAAAAHLPDPPAPVPALSLADIIGEPLVGGKIHCPYHDDSTPSCHVYPDGHFHCFGCDARGSVLDWLRDFEGLDEAAAQALLADWQAGTLTEPRARDDYTLKLALDLWEDAQLIAGTPAVDYLAKVRGIDVSVLPAEAPLRFHPRCIFGPGQRVPALLALYQDVATDVPAGIHRIRLSPEVFAGGKVERLSLGRWPAPRAIKLWSASESQLFVGEGLETVLAAATRLQYRDAPMQPWAAISRSSFTW